MTKADFPPMWNPAHLAKPDADTAVLGVNAASQSYWIVTWEEEPGVWQDVDTMQARNVTDWIDLPEPPPQ